MMNILSLYNRIGNTFRLNYILGQVYQLDSTIEFDKDSVVYYKGNYYSHNYYQNSEVISPELGLIKALITKQFALKLKSQGYQFKGKYKVYDIGREIKTPHTDLFKLYEGFEFRTVIMGENIFLAIDPKIITVVQTSIRDFLLNGADIDSLREFSVYYLDEFEGRILRGKGYLLATRGEGSNAVCIIKRYNDFSEVTISADAVFPEPRAELLQTLLWAIGKDFDIIELQRKLSFLDSKTSSRDRLLKTLEIVERLESRIFPLKFGDFEVGIDKTPIVVR